MLFISRVLFQIYVVLHALCCDVAAFPASIAQLNSTKMALSIIFGNQGIMSGTGGSSELLQAGVTQKAFMAFVHQYPSSTVTPAISQYIWQSALSTTPFISNATYDALSDPLDRLSNGNALVQLIQL